MNDISGSTAALLAHNSAFIPGGVSSINRIIDPPIAFAKAEGAYLWDIDGKRYVDCHAAFAPFLLGHNFTPINEAVINVLRNGESLFGAGPSRLEGHLAQLLCQNIAAVDKVCLLNTGSEATALAIRLSRAVTGRQHIIVIQGGYNGNHDEVACNVFNTLSEIGPRARQENIRCARLERAPQCSSSIWCMPSISTISNRCNIYADAIR